jgi:hypothetical protein
MEHDPAPPKTPQPPAEIRRLSQQLRHPDVANVGLTTTSKGEWALLVRVKGAVTGPIPEVERQAKGHPVIYAPAGPMPVARPAFPGRGE